MIRAYTQDEAVEKIGHAPSSAKVKHELDTRWSSLHGLSITRGNLFARVYDPVDEVYEYIGVDALAAEWIWYDGTPCGVEE
jgi:hypothetical protein